MAKKNYIQIITNTNILQQLTKKATHNTDATQMMEEESYAKLDRGYQDAMAGETRNAKEAFAAFRAAKKY